ncbi:hypothetical protein E2C01_039525 [Portunus trituberculatus]|uniref:Uncharacterized protein n=1 Tax=Portunus trituberculatus TaxID=210409 RepID=A0A5B7FKZ7_PORTR|nr:hypothetical protein [Portunus trituberculatus]
MMDLPHLICLSSVHQDSPPGTTPIPVIPISHPGCLLRWHISPSGWLAYQTALALPPDLSNLPLEKAAETLAWTLKAAGKTAFCFTTHHSPHRPGKLWWTDKCA